MNLCTFAEMGEVKQSYISSGRALRPVTLLYDHAGHVLIWFFSLHGEAVPACIIADAAEESMKVAVYKG